MKRKEFITGAFVVLGDHASAFCAGPATPEPEARRQKFQQAWIVSLIENLDSQVDEAARTKLMESCGRACARRGSLAPVARASKGNLDKLLEAWTAALGEKNVRRDGDVVQLSYTKCLCPLVAAGPATLSKTYCNCSRGYVLEIFEAAAGKPVTVELTHSIKWGDPACRFLVRL